MDIVSFLQANSVYNKESEMRNKKLTNSIKNGKPTLRVRLDEIYQNISSKVGAADDVTHLTAINLIKEHEWIDTLMVQDAYKGSYLLFDNLMDSSGLDMSKSEWVSYKAQDKKVVAAHQNSFLALKAIPNSSDLGSSLHIILNGSYYEISENMNTPNLYYWDNIANSKLPYVRQNINQNEVILIIPLVNKQEVESYGIMFVDKVV